MPLTYRLPGDLTNRDLAEDAPGIYRHLRLICETTMLVGRPKIDGTWLDRVLELDDDGYRVIRFPYEETYEEETARVREFWTEVHGLLRGMTTNASPFTAAKWRTRRREIVAAEVPAI